MKRLLFAPLLLRIAATVKAGRGIKLKGYGEDKYSWPIIYVYPEALDENYKYFPSTTSACSYLKLNVEEKNSLLIKAFKSCFGSERTQVDRIERRKKYCFGWN